MKVSFFWFSINKNSQLQLPISWNKDKNEILAEVLKQGLEYKYYSDILYRYSNRVWNYLIGELWKSSTKVISEVSEKWFEDKKISHYPHSKIIFNLSKDYNNDAGHIVGIEHKYEVFKDLQKQVIKLEENINIEMKKYWYAISFYPISDEGNFWSYIDKNKWKIEKLTFVYSVPNFLWLQNSLTDDLKDASSKYGITNSTVILENKNWSLDNINKEDDFISQSVEYASKWAWDFKIKVKWLKEEYSSKKSIKTLSIDELEIDWSSEELQSTLDKLFNRAK